MMPAKSGSIIKKQGEIVGKIAFATNVTSPITFLAVFINILNPGHDYENMIGFCVASNWVVCFIGCALIRFLFIISREIKKHLSNDVGENDGNQERNEKFTTVKNKMDKAWIALLVALIFIMIFSSAFLIWPFLTKNSSYYFPIFLFTAQSVFIVLEISVLNNSKKVKNSSSDIRKAGEPASKDNAVTPDTTANSADPSKLTPHNSEHQITVDMSRVTGIDYKLASAQVVSALNDEEV